MHKQGVDLDYSWQSLAIRLVRVYLGSPFPLHYRSLQWAQSNGITDPVPVIKRLQFLCAHFTLSLLCSCSGASCGCSRQSHAAPLPGGSTCPLRNSGIISYDSCGLSEPDCCRLLQPTPKLLSTNMCKATHIARKKRLLRT